jgi:hypothetical protein
MDDEPTDAKQATKRGGGGAAVLAVVMVGLVFLPLLYTLSIGPVIVMVDRDWIGKEWMPALEAVYWPLEWTAENVVIVGPAIMTYAEWWQERATATPAYAVPPPTPVNPPPAVGTPLPGPVAPTASDSDELPPESPASSPDTVAEPAAEPAALD